MAKCVLSFKTNFLILGYQVQVRFSLPNHLYLGYRGMVIKNVATSCCILHIAEKKNLVEQLLLKNYINMPKFKILCCKTQDSMPYFYRLGGLADKLFTSMDPKTPEAYCAIIKGMAKFFQVNKI